MDIPRIEINRASLPNGLRIVHSRDYGTAMVAVNLLYDTGARDEKRNLTGIAHLFEHLMFGGSANVPSFDATLQAAGGKSNAWTSNDFTNFYLTLPAQNIETAFYLESDRMLSPALSDESVEIQKGVVIEEFKQQCLDRPYGDLFHHLRRLSYAPGHPYSWPTLGLSPEHVAKVTAEDARNWFYAHYSPSNAILAVTGNVDFDKVLNLAEKWFGDIPARTITPRHLSSPGFPTQDIREDVRAEVPLPIIVTAVPMGKYGTTSYHAADTITDILSAGRAARFNTNLLYGPHHGMFSSAEASIIGSEHEGLLLLTARLSDNKDTTVDSAREIMLDEARKLAEADGISPYELERTFNNFEATFHFSNIDYASKATNLAMAEYHGEDINNSVDERRSLSADIIISEARKLFFDTPTISLAYRPNN